jgi:ADP-ribose pyrophosphatase YjhB (NUDIX family)
MSLPHSWQRTTLIEHSHCSYCGTAYPPDAGWPRTCPNCQEITWHNPLPVAVTLLPVHGGNGKTGLVVIRRSIEPAVGRLALPGGFIETGESWQEAAVRELREESGLTADPELVSLFGVVSGFGTINIFGLLPSVDRESLPPSAPTDEATEWLVLDQPEPLAFPSHTTMMESYFAAA